MPQMMLPTSGLGVTGGTIQVPIPNDTSLKMSRRDVSNAYLFGTGTVPSVEISSMENQPWGV